MAHAQEAKKEPPSIENQLASMTKRAEEAEKALDNTQALARYLRGMTHAYKSQAELLNEMVTYAKTCVRNGGIPIFLEVGDGDPLCKTPEPPKVPRVDDSGVAQKKEK